jgi:hypothetical protein
VYRDRIERSNGRFWRRKADSNDSGSTDGRMMTASLARRLAGVTTLIVIKQWLDPRHTVYRSRGEGVLIDSV